MKESNSRKKPERDLDILAEMVKIERLGKSGIAGISQLIDYLSDDREYLAGSAMKTLHGCLPMATLPERWRDDTPYEKSRTGVKIPDWLTEACDGWGGQEDFAHLCLQKLSLLKHEQEQDRFLEKLSTFMGARNRVMTCMIDAGKQAVARKFAKTIFRLQQMQFPRQLTLAVTMNCQLKCSYCISGCASPSNFQETSSQEIERLFDWMQQKGIKRIGLTGGEPTLFSKFEPLLEQIRAREFELYLATNGLASEKLTAAIIRAKPLCVTMHLTPEVLGSKRMDTYIRNAREYTDAGIYAIVRCNFLKTIDDPWAYLNVAKETGISEIRTAIPMPRATGGNQFVDSRRLVQYGNVLDRLVAGGQQTGVAVRLAKPFPVCFLARATARQFLANGSLAVACPVHQSGYANNIVVQSDLRYSACLGLDQLSDRPIVASKSLTRAAGTHRKMIQKRMHQPIMDICSACPLWKGGRCVGGCLSYRTSAVAEKSLPADRGEA